MVHKQENIELNEIVSRELNEKINTVKLLIYKDFPEIFEKIDFDNGEAFCDPLLFAFFRHKVAGTFPKNIETEFLEGILQGYFKDKKDFKLDHLFNLEEIAYLSNLGYFKKGEHKPFSSVVTIKDTSIQILRCTTPLFKVILETPEEDQLWDDKLYNNNIGYLNNAINFIKTHIPNHFKLIEHCCKYIYLFSTDPNNSNSFASGNALGTAFFNIYQNEYDEVFFVDDIAHQTGHIILNNINFNLKIFYKIDQSILVEDIIKKEDHRDVNILIHALCFSNTN